MGGGDWGGLKVGEVEGGGFGLFLSFKLSLSQFFPPNRICTLSRCKSCWGGNFSLFYSQCVIPIGGYNNNIFRFPKNVQFLPGGEILTFSGGRYKLLGGGLKPGGSGYIYNILYIYIYIYIYIYLECQSDCAAWVSAN